MMFTFLALVTLATLASVASLPRGFPLSPSGRIVGGGDTTIEEVPYQVSITTEGDHWCGGSIISKYYVLTAAHCLKAKNAPPIHSIRAGSADRSWGGSEHLVASVVIHESYGSNKYGYTINDIALIRVVEPFEFDETCQPIALFNENEEAPVGEFSVVTGWGDDGGFGYPVILQAVSLPIVSREECNKNYAGPLPEGIICAGFPEGGKDACQGDSGGPLAVNGRLAGIVSGGWGCAFPGYTGLYTEVAAFRGWIKAHSGV